MAASPKPKLEPIDYFTFLGYIKELDIKIYKPSQIECNFSHSELLGSGSSMIVYRGDLIEDPDRTDSVRVPVAVKVPNIKVKDMERDAKVFKVLADVRQELRMMKHFETHPNIINLYGVVFQDIKPVTIVELAEDSITDYLAKKKEEDTPVDWETKARFCCEVADGLQALHAAKIIHGDVKGDNILLFKDHEGKLVAKIIDYGYSATEATIERGGKTGGSLHFLAPECTKCAPTEMKVYENKHFNDKYAFGLFVWQVARDGEIPYDGMDENDIHNLKNSDTDLSVLMECLEEDTPQYFKDVVSVMTKYAPEEREDLAHIREIMKLDDISDASYSMVKNNLELYAEELPRDIAKADFSSIEFMSIPFSLKTKIYHNYEKEAANGDANAMFMLAICCSTGFGVKMDKEKTLEWCIKAAKAGSLNAIFNIVESYKIKELPVEPSVAFPWYLKAAEEGYYNVADQIHSCYMEGYGVEKDVKKAIDWMNISNRYQSIGSMSKVNMKIGETSLHRAARLGYVEEARFLLEQRNVDINAENNDGLTALHIAAQYGQTEVAKLLITSLGTGTNEKTNTNEALLRLALGRGHVEAVWLFADETSITTLDLSSSKLGNSETPFLVESLRMYTALTELELRSNSIGDEGASALAGYLEQNSTLTQLNLSENKIGNEGACALAECLRQNSTLTQLNLSGNIIGVEGTSVLAECLKQNLALTQLDLSCNEIGQEGGCALSEYLIQTSTLTHLILEDNEFGDEGACALAKGLEKNSTLIQLNISNNRIGKTGACALARLLKTNSTLIQLNLSLSQIGLEGARVLADSLEQNSTLTQLDLSYNKISDVEIYPLAECLKQNSALVQLDLSGNDIGKKGSCILADCLKYNSILAQLILDDSKISDQGVCALVEYLKQNSILTQLDLSDNDIGNEGARALAEYLKQNSTLTLLNLSRNKIDAEGFYTLAGCLKQNSTLIQLNLSGNMIGADGASALAEGLKQNSALTQLDISMNEIGKEGACALAECLKQNSALTKLNLSRNDIGKDGACALAESLKKNSTLIELNLWNNDIGEEGVCTLAETLKLNTTLTRLHLECKSDWIAIIFYL